jgi:hypothetical protein
MKLSKKPCSESIGLLAQGLEKGLNPHFSQGFYCGGAENHVYRVRMVFMRALPQTP